MPSINEELAALPHQRPRWANVKGRLLLLPRTGLTVVPTQEHRGGWACVVVEGNTTYPRGGWDLDVCYLEIATAIERELR